MKNVIVYISNGNVKVELDGSATWDDLDTVV
jgi:hypothetical protein